MHRCNSRQTNLRNQSFRQRKLFCNGKIDDRIDEGWPDSGVLDHRKMLFHRGEIRSQKRLLSDPGESVRRMFGATGSMLASLVLQLVAFTLF